MSVYNAIYFACVYHRTQSIHFLAMDLLVLSLLYIPCRQIEYEAEKVRAQFNRTHIYILHTLSRYRESSCDREKYPYSLYRTECGVILVNFGFFGKFVKTNHEIDKLQ